ncbi:protein kinase domain-containing protein [Cystobacter fuscus]
MGRFQDTYFVAMEHIEGLSPRELLKSHRPLPPTVVAYIGAEFGEALDYVHRRTSREGLPLNLVHRDVNPPNILLSRIGEVKPGDFGVARAAIHVRLTQADRVCGKLGYPAPEQARSGASPSTGARISSRSVSRCTRPSPGDASSRHPNGQRELARLVQPQSEEPTAVLPRA